MLLTICSLARTVSSAQRAAVSDDEGVGFAVTTDIQRALHPPDKQASDPGEPVSESATACNGQPDKSPASDHGELQCVTACNSQPDSGKLSIERRCRCHYFQR